MHVASLTIFEGNVDYEVALDEVRRRLHLVPRFRQKLAFVPVGQGRPVWIDDEHFNLHYHVRHTALPEPGTEDQLKRLAGRIMSQQLDRTKPLWEIWLVDRLAGDRFAMIAKTHHCMVDGVAGADITAVLLDLERNPEPLRADPWSPSGPGVRTPEDRRAPPWTPEPEPSPSQLLADALRERMTEPVEIARGVRATLRAPRRLLKAGSDFLGAMGALAWAGMNPAPESPINVRVGAHRRYEYVRASLEDFKTIKDTLGGTVNDVVLAVVTGAMRRFLQHRNVDVRGLELKAMVPMSTRSQTEEGVLGNHVTTMIAPLPVYESDPVTRLQIVRQAMADVKASKQAVGAETIMNLSGFAPPTILSQAARLQSQQRFVNMLVTNVPGPQVQLYSAGRALLDLFPMAPLGANQALGIAVMSYNGQMGFGLLADYDALPDVGVVAEGLEKSIAELLQEAEAAGARAEGNGSVGGDVDAHVIIASNDPRRS